MVTKYRLAKKVGVTPTHIIEITNRKTYASLPLALKIEKASNGLLKVEDIVRPEVAEALKEYLKLRCMSQSIRQEGESVSNT